ncbi:MAG: alpha/beta hydrolase [Candidatus Moranbacteria bacterium]|nr:alpha/beta hydrolase [Candidatus Moranbacteria bacterium]
MKRAIIVHCWGGYPQYCWYPWVKKELEGKGFQVEVPAFPETDLPKMNQWVPKLQEVVGEPDEELFLVGHSLGCATIMRYLENLKEDEKVGGVFFVAGFNENVGFDEIGNFFETPIDLEKIKTKSKNGFVAIHSDDDPYVDLKYADIFREKLNAEIIIKHNAKHFSGAIEGEDSCLELPDVVRSVDIFFTKR